MCLSTTTYAENRSVPEKVVVQVSSNFYFSPTSPCSIIAHLQTKMSPCGADYRFGVPIEKEEKEIEQCEDSASRLTIGERASARRLRIKRLTTEAVLSGQICC